MVTLKLSSPKPHILLFFSQLELFLSSLYLMKQRVHPVRKKSSIFDLLKHAYSTTKINVSYNLLKWLEKFAKYLLNFC
jgi:hypothetical protein